MTTTTARTAHDPPTADDAEPLPLTFVRLTELAQHLPARQLEALIALLRFCWTAPRCWPTQKTLAGLRRCAASKINRGLHELAAAGVVAIRYQRVGKRRRACIYEIAPGYWLPTPGKARVSAANSQARTEVDSRSFSKKEPPVAPHEGGDAQVVVDQLGEEEGTGIEGEAIEAAPNPALEDDQRAAPAARGAVHAEADVRPAEARPYRYRNRQRQPGDPPLPRRKRRRQILSEMIPVLDELVARRSAAQPACDALPPPPEIMPPARIALTKRDRFQPKTQLFEGGMYAIQARIARFYQTNRNVDPDPAGELPASRRIA